MGGAAIPQCGQWAVPTTKSWVHSTCLHPTEFWELSSLRPGIRPLTKQTLTAAVQLPNYIAKGSLESWIITLTVPEASPLQHLRLQMGFRDNLSAKLPRTATGWQEGLPDMEGKHLSREDQRPLFSPQLPAYPASTVTCRGGRGPEGVGVGAAKQGQTDKEPHCQASREDGTWQKPSFLYNAWASMFMSQGLPPFGYIQLLIIQMFYSRHRFHYWLHNGGKCWY